MSKIVTVGSYWKGFPSIRKLIVFGDSYSSTEYFYSSPIPDAHIPLGVPFPGTTYNEHGLPNWIGHLITKYCPKPRYVPPEVSEDIEDQPELQEMMAEWQDNPLLVYNFAKGGETRLGVLRQIKSLFMDGLGKKPDWARWTPEETLFVIWVGTNDCAGPLTGDLHEIFHQYLAKLYEAGARNFLLIDVPAVHRIPGVPISRQDVVKERIKAFDTAMEEGIQEFLTTQSDATVLLFSSFEAFSTVLNDPEGHGMSASDVRVQRGTIWMDHVHPTSKFHEHLAEKVAKFLDSVAPRPSGGIQES